MSDETDKPEAEIERELRQTRKFTPQEAMARMAGSGAMRGASPVSPMQQAEVEVGTWLRSHVADAVGALPMLLHRQLKSSELLLENLDRPLAAVAEHCRRVLASDFLLKELVREADVEWGQRMDERPHFQRDGSVPDPGDPYTLESVREALDGVARQLGSTAPS